ncbi:uncharacterized protein BDZ99DRAFT_514538 [Mytilinidion resinicola]|uniref:Uncharacterized protein n=1 Tax=Mytilinidion resinicola TaxID=574789 RepID=A0A6A6Z426_9PEZI|nr:uncharacterized protein BDZ99DRAFT_514538 [Mytilinidion resinicola]KAF2815902.1 hypothetical protein BDZ99DRAFT_514538 [Mytilinidion resinicola]
MHPIEPCPRAHFWPFGIFSITWTGAWTSTIDNSTHRASETQCGSSRSTITQLSSSPKTSTSPQNLGGCMGGVEIKHTTWETSGPIMEAGYTAPQPPEPWRGASTGDTRAHRFGNIGTNDATEHFNIQNQIQNQNIRRPPRARFFREKHLGELVKRAKTETEQENTCEN